MFPQSEQAFYEGPCLIFKVFEAISFREALDCLTNSFDFAIQQSIQSGLMLPSDREKEFINEFKLNTLYIKDSKSIPQRGTDKLTYLERCIIYSVEPNNNGSNASVYYPLTLSKLNRACLYLAEGYIQSRFVDNQKSLSHYIFELEILKTIEKYSGIPDYLWLKADSDRALDEFQVAIEYFYNNQKDEYKSNMLDHNSYTKSLFEKIKNKVS